MAEFNPQWTQTLVDLFQEKLWLEAYDMILTMAEIERKNVAIDTQSRTSGLNLVLEAQKTGDKDLILKAFEDISNGVKDSNAPMLSASIKEAIRIVSKKSIFASFVPAIFMLAVIGIAIKTTK